MERISIKRVYEPASPGDGQRVLVDRLWPRGISRERAHLTAWLKEVGPSPQLRKWFGHDPSRFEEFSTRYRRELDTDAGAVGSLLAMIAKGHVTLLYAAHDKEHNHALVLADYLREKPVA